MWWAEIVVEQYFFLIFFQRYVHNAVSRWVSNVAAWYVQSSKSPRRRAQGPTADGGMGEVSYVAMVTLGGHRSVAMTTLQHSEHF